MLKPRFRHILPFDLDDHTLRDIGFTRAEYRFLVMLGPPAGGGDARGIGRGCEPGMTVLDIV